MAHSVMEFLKRIFGQERDTSMIQKTQAKKGKKPGVTTGMANKHRGLTRVLQPAHTIRLRMEHEGAVASSRQRRRLRLSSSGITDRGLVRDHNEDAFSLFSFDDKSLFVVADGMGGHDSGEVASKTAADTVCRVVHEEYKQYGNPLRLVEQAIRRANTEVRRRGSQLGSDMGTTLSIVLVSDGTAYVANVGDSRVYWMENGTISQVTTDHSLVAKLVDAGRMKKNEARNHPQANLLYRTVGIDEEVTVDTFTVDLKKGGLLLLCTDGLWGELTDEEIQRLCVTERNVKELPSRLVQTANEHGGKDNITAVVVRVE